MIWYLSVQTKIDTTGLKLELENNMKLQISVPDGHWTYIAITFVVVSRSSNYNTTAHIRQYLCWDHVSKVVQVSVSEVQSVEYQSCCINQDKKPLSCDAQVHCCLEIPDSSLCIPRFHKMIAHENAWSFCQDWHHCMSFDWWRLLSRIH